MSDESVEGTAEAPPSKKPTPWSVRKIVEQVTGRPLESMQDPPGTRRPSRTASPPPREEPPLERYHQETGGAALALLASPEETPGPSEDREASASRPAVRAPEPDEPERNPTLRAFLPGSPSPLGRGRTGRPPSLPLTRPLPREVVEEVERMREEESLPALEKTEPHARGHAATRELEKVYLSYLLMHMDRLTEPALKYLRHAVEEECEERGMIR